MIAWMGRMHDDYYATQEEEDDEEGEWPTKVGGRRASDASDSKDDTSVVDQNSRAALQRYKHTPGDTLGCGFVMRKPDHHVSGGINFDAVHGLAKRFEHTHPDTADKIIQQRPATASDAIAAARRRGRPKEAAVNFGPRNANAMLRFKYRHNDTVGKVVEQRPATASDALAAKKRGPRPQGGGVNFDFKGKRTDLVRFKKSHMDTVYKVLQERPATASDALAAKNHPRIDRPGVVFGVRNRSALQRFKHSNTGKDSVNKLVKQRPATAKPRRRPPRSAMQRFKHNPPKGGAAMVKIVKQRPATAPQRSAFRQSIHFGPQRDRSAVQRYKNNPKDVVCDVGRLINKWPVKKEPLQHRIRNVTRPTNHIAENKKRIKRILAQKRRGRPSSAARVRTFGRKQSKPRAKWK